MMILNFLYYIIFRVFKLIQREEAIEHSLAASFFSFILMTNIMTVLFVTGFFHFMKNHFGLNKLYWIVLVVFGGCYFFNKWYFLKKENYKEIIKASDERYYSSMRFISILGIIYIIGSFFGFWALGFYFRKM